MAAMAVAAQVKAEELLAALENCKNGK